MLVKSKVLVKKDDQVNDFGLQFCFMAALKKIENTNCIIKMLRFRFVEVELWKV